MGGHPSQDESGVMTLEAKERLISVQPIKEDHVGKEKGDRAAAPSELIAYRSSIGNLLYINRLLSPAIAFGAFNAAGKCADLSCVIFIRSTQF